MATVGNQAKPGRPPKPPIKPNLAYCCSFNLLPLKLLEIGCTLASLILALEYEGAGEIITIEIISALSLVTALSWVLLYSLNVNARFPDFFPRLMFIYHLLMTIINIIATICAAILWPQFKLTHYYVACTFTSLVASICFLIDTIHNFLSMRGSAEEVVVFPCSPWQSELTI